MMTPGTIETWLLKEKIYKKIKGKFGKALSFNDLNNDAGSATTSSAKHIRIHSDDGHYGVNAYKNPEPKHKRHVYDIGHIEQRLY